MNKYKLAKYLRYTARSVLLIVSVFWFVFALLSGADNYGEGLIGVLRNSPNALPWLLLSLLVYISWKKELIGGSLISLSGLVTIVFFKTYQYIELFLLISFPLIILGVFLIISHYLSKNNKNE